MIIYKLYRWLWYVMLQRREPFTFQLARMVAAHGMIFWIVYIGIQWWLFWLWYSPAWWYKYAGLIALGLNAWLIDHLIDYCREHPENQPNP